MISRIVIIVFFISTGPIEYAKSQNYDLSRGDIGTYGNKFVWTGNGEVFVPNYIMIDALTRNINPEEFESFREINFVFQIGNYSDLRFITEENLERFVDEFFFEHGFNGVHVPLFNQWFHIGDNVVTENDSVPDPRTFDKLEMIINMVSPNPDVYRPTSLVGHVYYKENTDKIEFQFTGQPKKVNVVDTRKSYHEIELGVKNQGKHIFEAPYVSNWAIAAENY